MAALGGGAGVLGGMPAVGVGRWGVMKPDPRSVYEQGKADGRRLERAAILRLAAWATGITPAVRQAIKARGRKGKS